MTTTESPNVSTPRVELPAIVRVVGVLFCVMALTSLVLGVVESFAIRVDRAVVGVGGAIILIAYGVFLAWVGHGLWRGRGRAQGPAIAVGLLHLPVAWSFVGGTTWWIGVLLGATSLVTIVALVLPRSMTALGRVRREPED